MPVTKNSLIRLMILDELLSDRLHAYTMNDLWERTNDALVRKDMEDVSKRCIEKDILCIENEPFYMELDKWKEDGKMRYRYTDKRARIFRRELKKEESLLLGECLNTLGQFDGLAHFDWIESYRIGLKLEEHPRIISFSNNPYLQGSNLLGTLFDYIANRVVVRLSYHTFGSSEQKGIDFHPYLLKQYNDRWFLFGAADEDDKILSFALDRIDEVTPLPARKYRKCKVDLDERFEDIIGITFIEGNPVEHIVFWVSDRSLGYVQTKPIHGSQTPIHGDNKQALRTRYSHLQGGAFFSIDCRENYELIRELRSFGSNLLVISPRGIQDKVYEEIAKMAEEYKKLRT